MRIQLMKKIKNSVLTLRFSILSIFITLFVCAMLSVILLTYFRYSTAISVVSFRLMKEAATVIQHDIVNEIQDVSLECQFAADLMSGGEFRNQKDLIRYTYYLMHTESATLPSVQAAFWGGESGDFVVSDKTNNHGIESVEVDQTKRGDVSRRIHRDPKNHMVKVGNLHDISYDPRMHSWYVLAKKTGKLVWTDIVPFPLTGHMGATAAVPVYDKAKNLKGVFGLNVRLDYLRNFVERLKVSPQGVVFVVTNKGKVAAFPGILQYNNPSLMDVHVLPAAWIVASYDKYKKENKNEFIYRYAGKNYFAVYQLIPYLANYGWMIAVVAPEDDFMPELLKANLIGLLITLFILLLGIFLMSKLVYLVVNPMRKLVKETDKIKNFELHGDGPVRSKIKEILMLSEAIHSMKQGLRIFQKYVPALLVRQLVESRKDILSGGEKKHLAILFSDIENFTGISENVDQHQLMNHLCEYFNVVSHVIGQERGTIDKYIGDSLMAFWGAPLPEEFPCEQAAHAALRVIKSLSELNEKWSERGILKFHTRIGLHYGEVIVGNVGSDERLNYTAIGDAINLTSRLEGVNKIYGSQILVSQSIYEMIKNKFVLRFLDRVAVKGKTANVDVYELLAENSCELLFDLDAYQAQFSLAYAAYQQRKWVEARIHFENCLQIYAEDSLARVYISRCDNFQKTPPGSDWDGVWRLLEK